MCFDIIWKNFQPLMKSKRKCRKSSTSSFHVFSFPLPFVFVCAQINIAESFICPDYLTSPLVFTLSLREQIYTLLVTCMPSIKIRKYKFSTFKIQFFLSHFSTSSSSSICGTYSLIKYVPNFLLHHIWVWLFSIILTKKLFFFIVFVERNLLFTIYIDVLINLKFNTTRKRTKNIIYS